MNTSPAGPPSPKDHRYLIRKERLEGLKNQCAPAAGDRFVKSEPAAVPPALKLEQHHEPSAHYLTTAQKAASAVLAGLSLFGAVAAHASAAAVFPHPSSTSQSTTLAMSDPGRFGGSKWDEPSFDNEEDRISGKEKFHPPGIHHTYQDSKKMAAEYGRRLYERVQKEGVPDPSTVIIFHEKDFGEYDYRTVKVPDKLFQESGSVLPDNTGRITHFAFQLDGTLPPEVNRQVMDAYRIFLRNAGPDVKFTFVVEGAGAREDLAKMVRSLRLQNPERVQIVPAGENISIWIRDSMISARDSDGSPKILVPDRVYWPSKGDVSVPGIVARESRSVKIQESPFIRVDGGNILSTKDAVYVGNESVRQTAEHLEFLSRTNRSFEKKVLQFYEARTGRKLDRVDTSEKVLRELIPEVFQSTFQKKIFVVGADDPATPRVEQQPSFHIDMAATVLDDKTVLVGDPSLALKLLKGMSAAERAKANENLKKALGTSQPDVLEDLEDINRGGGFFGGDGKAFQDDFDAMARDFAGKGFSAVRVPYLRQPFVGLPFITYNNVILEIYRDAAGAEVKNVYMPVYGIGALDENAKAQYESRGFRVIPVPAAAITGIQGAVHCITQVVERAAK